MSHPTCAVCGFQADGADHVRVEVERVPPEEPATTYYFHKRCFRPLAGLATGLTATATRATRSRLEAASRPLDAFRDRA